MDRKLFENLFQKNTDTLVEILLLEMWVKKLLRIDKEFVRNEDFLPEYFSYPYKDYVFFSLEQQYIAEGIHYTQVLNRTNLSPEENLFYNLKLWSLYWYPPCCTKHFCKYPQSKWEKMQVYIWEKIFFLPHYLCDSQCECSLELKNKLELFSRENFTV